MYVLILILISYGVEPSDAHITHSTLSFSMTCRRKEKLRKHCQNCQNLRQHADAHADAQQTHKHVRERHAREH
jgi:hypothetical protein